MNDKCFIHVDLDAFYASVEQLDNPEYKGKPVIVGSLPTDKRGVVSTCSYEARAYGVRSAMPIATAVKLCPHGIFIRGRMDRYQEKSKEVMSVFSEFSPDVHQISVDEAFIDISGTERLFGPPEKVAQELKQRVFEKTQLTVSVGIASTKYIAKICSGMKKPDGLFIVERGKEEDFMLQLPIKDIWGIGEKTLSRLNEAGFYSSKDIKKASLNLLKNLFGEATGIFLYNSVRGTLQETFNKTPKTKSISSETTFSFDVTDRYTIDTALMHLAWDVMFRLFSEKWTSRTAHVKIRYEDFTTLSVQETTTRTISSADDLFTRVKKLFDKKYESGRPIRLLGIAAQNIEDSELPVQQELFDFGDEKKRAVEKTVIEMQKKNPTLNIKKARLIRNNMILLFMLSMSFFSFTKNFTMYAQDQNSFQLPLFDSYQQSLEPRAIFNVSPQDDQVEFYAQGTWEAKFSSFLDISNSTSNSQGIEFSFDAPIFIQKTDLTVWFLLQDTWYFEANVADDYEESTVAAGYYGENILKHVRIGNRHISFPETYGVTDAEKGVGSGSNEAPGIMAHWNGDDWVADFLVRYDLTEQMEKTWVGENESNETIINISDWQRGARFIFPENFVHNITAIFMETDNTNEHFYTDDSGISYKKLSTSEYLIVPSKNMLILDKPTDKNILVQYENTTPDLGSFNDPRSFLGVTQQVFFDYDLTHYTVQRTTDSYSDFITTIDGKSAIIAQKSNYFSPFLDSSLYSLSSFSQVDSVSIISNSTKISEKDYGSVLLDSSTLEIPGFTDTDIFDEKKTYIQAFIQNRSSTSNDASLRFPFASQMPLVYLTPTADTSIIQKSSDIVISVTNYSQNSVLDIGTNAIAGSINVYRNGIKENLFRYDNKTGVVKLTSTVGTFDTIRITWRESTEIASNGSVSAAIGFERQLNENLAMNVSSSLLWPIFESTAYTDENSYANGSINAAYTIQYNKNELALTNTLSASFQSPDITNTYRIESMDDTITNDIFLASNSVILLPENFTPTLNARPNGTAPNPALNAGEKVEIEVNTTRISDFDGYIVTSDWEITEHNNWVSFGIDLDESAQDLASTQNMSIWIKNADLPNDYKIFLQLGVSDDESQLFESPLEIPTWEITSIDVTSDVETSFDRSRNDWQKITLLLKDEDRAKLEVHQNARIIIQAGNVTASARGNISVGPLELYGSAFNIQTNDIIQFDSKSVRQSESNKAETTQMSLFNIGETNFVQYFNWDTGITSEKGSVISYFESIPMSSYESIGFFAYVSTITAGENSSLQLVLERPTEYSTEIALDIELHESFLLALQDSWHEITFNLITKKMYIGTREMISSSYTVNKVNTNVAPTKFSAYFKGIGEMYLDELYLENAIWEFASENKLDIAWSNPELDIKNNDFTIIGKPEINSIVRAGVSVPLETEGLETEIGLVVDSNAKLDILGFSTEGILIFSSSNQENLLSNQNNFFLIESAGHKITTTPFSLLTKIITLQEEYRYMPVSNSATKVENIELHFLPLGFNLETSFRTEAEQTQNAFTQDVQIINTFIHSVDDFQYSVSANMFAFQNGYSETFLSSSYGSSWLDLSQVQFSIGNESANKRNIGISLNQKFTFPFNDFAPQLYLEAGNVYTDVIESVNTSTDRISFILPVTFGQHSFSASWSKKSFSTSTTSAGGNYFDDTNFYIKNLQARSWAYISFPFYDLFSASITNNMLESAKNNTNTTSTGYTSQYSLNWQRKFSPSALDILIPTKASIAFSRDIRATSIDVSDIVQLSSNIDFLAFNTFGRFSALQTFNWYEQEEILQSLRVSYSTDKNDLQNWRLEFSGYNQVTFFLQNNETIRTLVEGSIDTNTDWNAKIEGAWNRDGVTSLLLDGMIFFFPNIIETNQGIERENSIYASFAKTTQDFENSDLEQLYGVNHSVEAFVTNFASIGLEIAVELLLYNESFAVQNTLTLSGKLSF